MGGAGRRRGRGEHSLGWAAMSLVGHGPWTGGGEVVKTSFPSTDWCMLSKVMWCYVQAQSRKVRMRFGNTKGPK